MDSIVLIFASVVVLAFLAVLYLIVTDKSRFLNGVDLHQWRENDYLRSLPNFLQALYNHRFPSAWPARADALSAFLFRLRVAPLLKRKTRRQRQLFLQQHITLFALLEVLRPFIQDYILEQQYRIADKRLHEMADTVERDILAGFLESVRVHRAAFQAGLSARDKGILLDIVHRQFIPTLRMTHAVFQEHGYSLMPQFTQLRRWQDMTGHELVQELPALPVLRTTTHASARGR